MKTRRLGKIGFNASIIALGGCGLGNMTQQEANEAIQLAISYRVNYIDVAPSYGEAEVEDRLNRGAVDKLIISKSLSREKIKMLEKLAKASSTEIHIVTNETAEGVQFDNLGGVAGLLRFEIHE